MAATSPGRLSSLARVMPPAWHTSEQVRPPPWLAEDVLREEGQHGLVPDDYVPGRQDPVVLVREGEELGIRGPARQVGPEPQRLADRDPVILVPVDHQHRRPDGRDMQVRRILQVASGLRQWVTEMPAPV